MNRELAINSFKNMNHDYTKWREENPTELLDLSGVDLRQVDFTDKNNLNYIDFSGCNIKGANFSGTDLRGSNFSKIEADRFTSFERAIIDSSVSFRDATMIGVIFSLCGDKSLIGVDFSGAILKISKFHQCNLTDAKFVGADLEGCEFNGANISRTNFSSEGGVLSRVVFQKACNTGGAIGPNFKGLIFKNSCRLSGVDFSYADFSGVTIEEKGVFFGNKPNFYECNFSEAVFDETDFSYSCFENSDFRGVKFYECRLCHTKLSGSNFSEVEFHGSDLTGSDWVEVQIDSNTKFDMTKFKNNQNEHPVLNDNSDTIRLRGCLSFFNWEKIRFISNLPMFGISWTSFGLVLVLIHLIKVFNESDVASYINDQVTFDFQIEVPWRAWALLLSTLFLVIGSTVYRIKCPRRIQEHSQSKWVEHLGHPRHLYLEYSLKYSNWQKFTFVVFSVGSLISLLIVFERFVIAILYAWS